MQNEVNVTGKIEQTNSFAKLLKFLQLIGYDESSHMSFLEGSGADLLTNASNTPLCSENEADKSNLQENLRFDSDDSVLDSDYEDSTSTNNGNSSNLDDDELLNEAPTTSQRAYSRKQSCTRRNLGKAYVNVKDVVVSERKLRPLIIDCRMKCKSKVPLAFQKSIFNKYWSLGTYNQRILFIGSLIEITDKKTQYMQKHPERPRERKFQAAYYVEFEGQRVQVCQKCFLQCFDESTSFVKTVLKKKLHYPNSDLVDKRGSGGGKNILTDDKVQLVRDYINSFPKYESHYTRRDTNCQYLHAVLSRAKCILCFAINTKPT